MLKTFKVKFIDTDGAPNEKLLETDSMRQLLEYLSEQEYAETITSIQKVNY